MTESVREPIGLPPRRPTPVQNLLKANRTTLPRGMADEGQLSQKLENPTAVEHTSSRTNLKASSGDAGEKLQQVTFYMDPHDLGRAKAAYKATGGLEGDRTWSNFIASAVVAEVTRRQEKYTSSNPFKSDNEKLPPGRKV